jgi:hypothetical protein
MKTLATLTLLSVCLSAAPHAARAQVIDPNNPTIKVFVKANTMPFYNSSKDESGVLMHTYWLTGSKANTEVVEKSIRIFDDPAPVEGVQFTAYFTYPGKTYAAPRQIMLKLYSTKKGGRIFSDGDKLSVVADGQSLGVGDSDITSRTYTSDTPKRGTEYAKESLETPLSVEDLNRLAAAKNVELKVGAQSWKLGQTPLKALRRLAEAIGEAK